MKFKYPITLRHLLEYIIIKRSRLFDTAFYKGTYPEVKETAADPIWHYIRYGWRCGNNPSPRFDTTYYLGHYPDVRQAGINPLVHFIRKGRLENRMPRESLDRLYPRYPLWVKEYDLLTHKDERKIRQKITGMPSHPIFTIFTVVDQFDEEVIAASLSSLHEQRYPHWEAWIFIDKSENIFPETRSIRKLLRDPRVKVISYKDNIEVPKALNRTLDQISGDFLGMLRSGASLSPHALYVLAEEASHHSEAAVLYTDEDRLNVNGLRISPYFKPDWNPELLLHQDYINNFAVYRTDLVRKIGGFHTDQPCLLAWDLAIRITETALPEGIIHVPFPFCHVQDDRAPTDAECHAKHEKSGFQDILQAHFNHLNISARVMPAEPCGIHIIYPLPEPEPLVSIIIPTRDNHQMLTRCLESLHSHTEYKNFEILIIDNRSVKPETLAFFDTLSAGESIRVLAYPHPFNFSAINNFAVDAAQGEIMLFLNDDTEVITDGWLKELANQAIRPEIGAVGAMLYYPDDTIQHAGVVLGLNGVAGHIYQNRPQVYRGVRNRAVLCQNLTALTAACLAVEKQKFLKISGFDAVNLPVAFNDVDLCIRLYQAGYHNLWTPHVKLYHHESATRGPDETSENIARFDREVEYMQETYGDLLNHDPAYNLNLSLVDFNFNLAFPPRVNKPWRE